MRSSSVQNVFLGFRSTGKVENLCATLLAEGQGCQIIFILS